MSRSIRTRRKRLRLLGPGDRVYVIIPKSNFIMLSKFKTVVIDKLIKVYGGYCLYPRELREQGFNYGLECFSKKPGGPPLKDEDMINVENHPKKA